MSGCNPGEVIERRAAPTKPSYAVVVEYSDDPDSPARLIAVLSPAMIGGNYGWRAIA